ncbi:MAG TPA: response regulator [Pseudobdellovibrionaceae bacterium]|nr:response regulator [Pseudobdellovibrionaceae bacterium]
MDQNEVPMKSDRPADQDQEISERGIVAIVDDNKTDVAIASLMIERHGLTPMHFDLFSDLTKFIRTARDQVKLILLDVNMPGLSGVDILKRLKRDPQYREIPIMMMTGDCSVDTVKVTITNGAVDYIVKPLDPMVFDGKLSRILQVDTSAAQKEWVEYRLNQSTNGRVSLQIPGTLVSVGELTMTVKSPMSALPGSVFSLDTSLFKDVSITSVPCRIEACTPVDDEFVIKCSIVGLSEGDLQKIRIFCKSLWKTNLATA